MKIEIKKDIYEEICNLLNKSRESIISSVNSTMTKTYYLIGKWFVEEEQNGNERAEYGKNLIKELSEKLLKKFGKGFSKKNLEQMRMFYIKYSKSQTLSAEFKLNWSHYLVLMRIDNIEERNFYEIEASQNNWSLRELKRQINSALYERLVLSRNKEAIKLLWQICKDKNNTLVKLTLPKDNNQIFASKYMTVLPTDEEFKKVIEE